MGWPKFMKTAARRILLGTGGSVHAIREDGRRSAPKGTIASEDAVTSQAERQKVLATTREQRRNMELAQWIMGVHLDSVSKFRLQVKTDDKELTQYVERYLRGVSVAERFDARGMFGLEEYLRLLEGMRFLDGDVFSLAVTGGKVQGIESDRIREVTNGGEYRANVKGVALDGNDGPAAYAVHRRSGTSGYVFQGWYDKSVMSRLGYYWRFDQVRGVSPVVTTVNRLQDLYEGLEAMAIKTKFHAMFGIGFEGEEAMEDDQFETRDESTGEAATSGSSQSDLNFDIQPGLKVKTDGKIKVIESGTPHAAYMDWSMLEVQIALLAADIPITYFDSRRSSYSAREADIERYESACEWKRLQPQAWLQATTMRQLLHGYSTGALDLDRWGVTPEGLAGYLDWMPGGIPFFNRKAETEAAISAIGASLDSWQRWCRRHGTDAYEIADENAQMQKYFRENEMTVWIGKPGQEPVGGAEPTEGTDDNNGGDNA